LSLSQGTLTNEQVPKPDIFPLNKKTLTLLFCQIQVGLSRTLQYLSQLELDN